MSETWVCTECGALGVIGTPHRISAARQDLCWCEDWMTITNWLKKSAIDILRHEFVGPRCCERDTDGDGNCPRHPATV